MPVIPLVEHERPRVALFDFSPAEVEKFCKAGFTAKRGATGAHPNDNGQFSFPFPVQEVEVAFAQVRSGSFSTHRQAQSDSCEPSAVFQDLLREIEARAGWLVLFVEPECPVQEFAAFGIEQIGVASQAGYWEPACYKATFERYENAVFVTRIPLFRGHTLKLNEDEPEAAILRRYLKSDSTRLGILSCVSPSQVPANSSSSSTTISVRRRRYPLTFLIEDESLSHAALALKIPFRIGGNFIPFGGSSNLSNEAELRKIVIKKERNGGILFLPDFGANNINVALGLMQDVISPVSPHLFDAAQHSWLERYQSASVLQLQARKEEVLARAQQEAERLDRQADQARQEFAWLPGLLVHTGDEFASDVALALQFLGLEAVEVDHDLQPGDRRKEDFHIRDPHTGYFAIGEAKTTGKGRGAAEEFITKTQTHQGRYSRERKTAAPPALLFVNYAIDIEPSHRASRFYNDDLCERLEDAAITAVDSVALWELCQAIMRQALTKDHVRSKLISGAALVRSGTFQDLD